MDIIFYKVTKRQNSTYQPEGTGTTYECIIKDDCSILSPVIRLDIGLVTSPTKYNYAYIADWGRYYFISDWTFSNRMWQASLSVDVLATYKTQIGNYTGYVLRSASDYDGDIIDTTYPQKSTMLQAGTMRGLKLLSHLKTRYHLYTVVGGSSTTYSSTWEGSLGENFNLNSGYFYVTILSSTVNGAYNTYCMNYSEYASLMNQLFTTDYSSYDKGTLTNDVYKYIVDPLQYIVQVKWCPFEIPTADIAGQTLTSFKIGGLSNTYQLYCKDVTGVKSTRIVTLIDEIPSHPQFSNRGNWLNNSPYTICTLDAQPFGSLELNRAVITNDSDGKAGIRIEWDMDVYSGDALLTVKNSTSTDFNNYTGVLGTLTGNFMIDIPIAQTKTSVLGLLGGALAVGGQSLANAGTAVADTSSDIASSRTLPEGVTKVSLASANTGWGSSTSSSSGGIVDNAVNNIATNIGNGIAKIGSALAGSGISVSTKGSRGSLVGFRDPRVYYWNSQTVSEDKSNSGRPLCKLVKLNTLSGYIMCREGDISLDATQQEKGAVASYLKTGFFYE